MAAYKKPNKRHFKQKTYKGVKFKSSYEATVAKYLDEIGASWEYEPEKFPYTLPVSYYTPDFKVTYKDGTTEYLEVKGFFDPAARVKMHCIKDQYPDLNVVMHFMKEYTRLTPRSPVTYLEWAEKHGYKVRFFNSFGTWLSDEDDEPSFSSETVVDEPVVSDTKPKRKRSTTKKSKEKDTGSE